MARPSFLLAGAGTSLIVGIGALYAALFMSHACGDETAAPPDDDSPQAAYCDFWTHPDDRVTLALGLLFYAPAVAPLLGGIVAARTGRHVAYSIATVASLLVVAAWTTLAAALPG